MDKTTLIGIIGGWLVIALAIVLGGAGFQSYIDIPSVIIVIGGTTLVTVGQFEKKDLSNLGKAIGIAFKEVEVREINILVEDIISYGIKIKKNGIMSIESTIIEENDVMFKEAFNLLIDGIKPEAIESIMEMKLEHLEIRHKIIIGILSNIGGTAGSMGMAGTLIGLVAMLANLADPSSVGPAMAVALLTTLYGALIGTLFAGLIESKLEQKHIVEMLNGQVITRAVFMLASEEPIGNVKLALKAIIPASQSIEE
jgi:chemotaxis protein MotA